MDRKKKLALNTATSLLYQVVGIVCGFILPQMFIRFYGSMVNGVVSSITQFLGFISLCECGVGAVVQSALYRPLAEEDAVAYSKIYLSSERFFRKIAWLLVAYTAVLMVVFPLMTTERMAYWDTLLLVFVISISSFAQYYFGMTYRLFLSADQLGFIQLSLQSATLLLNTGLSILLMYLGAPVQAVKLLSSVLFLAQPVVFAMVAKRRYRIDRSIVLTEEPLKQKWNGLSQHIAAVILGGTDTIVLTLFSTFENVSVYNVYFLVTNGVKQIIVSLTGGVQALLGNMLARNERETLSRTFATFEWILHTVTTVAFTMTGILMIPFVRVYTADFTDADYIVPLFSILIAVAYGAYCLRLPYNMMVLAAGHYKETQMSAILEAAINLVLSVLMVIRFGLVGVAVGTLVAMMYRTVYLAYYLKKHILERPFRAFLKHIATDIVSAALTAVVVLLCPSFFTLSSVTYLSWVVLAIKVGVVTVAVALLLNLLVYKKECAAAFAVLKKRFASR